jgi:hypothetical protein
LFDDLAVGLDDAAFDLEVLALDVLGLFVFKLLPLPWDDLFPKALPRSADLRQGFDYKHLDGSLCSEKSPLVNLLKPSSTRGYYRTHPIQVKRTT